MNVTLWILQGLLALHTLIGAVWKFSNSEHTVPSISAIPHGVWLAISVIEIPLAIMLIAPLLNRSLGSLPPIAALCIVGIMLLYCGLHFASGATEHSEVIYWLVVAAVCAFIAYGRFVLRPLQQ